MDDKPKQHTDIRKRTQQLSACYSSYFNLGAKTLSSNLNIGAFVLAQILAT
ncbi:uncharacterized protein PHALS_04540 [Plasmopara halstedii]|uniref:Uncharacterized protein n=1 Tax=Plasmopara halstedii TaxID=4781 RepID=A0A0P1A944_PLAHL|nr:uncharacterized protein PHALS_04540 [Plasmopara halstedii]CEG37079.1 hypothetical protein PHALS_04540 [Plasmopara halstedii]|eukprot:XP_024573448.1 hypothetical protein PHALS_04540 [Plasmopara halstedii]